MVSTFIKHVVEVGRRRGLGWLVLMGGIAALQTTVDMNITLPAVYCLDLKKLLKETVVS